VRDANGAVNQIAYWSRDSQLEKPDVDTQSDTLYFMPFFSTKDAGLW
jgi:hypothetical protein